MTWTETRAYDCRDLAGRRATGRGLAHAGSCRRAPDVDRESHMGSAADSQRACQAGHRAVSDYHRQVHGPASQTGLAHVAELPQQSRKDLVAVDFFVVPTATFQVLFVFLILAHDRRRVLHFNVTNRARSGPRDKSCRPSLRTRHLDSCSETGTESMADSSAIGWRALASPK